MAVTVKGTANAAAGATVTIPTHAVGDIILIYAYRNASNTIPSKPAASGTVPAWADIDAVNGGNSNSSRTAQFVATATNHTSGTWTNATGMIAIVLQGNKATTPIGGHAEAGSSAASQVLAPAVTMSDTSGSSLLVQFFGNILLSAWGAAPSGYTQQATIVSTGRVGCDTKDTNTSDGSVTQTVTSANSGYRGAQVEVLAGIATVPLGASTAVVTTTLAVTAQTTVTFAASSAVASATVALSAQTTVVLGAASAVSSATLAVKATTFAPLGVASAQSSATLTLTAQTQVPLAASTATASTTLAISAQTAIPLAASSGAVSTSLAITAPTSVALGSAQAVSSAALAVATPALVALGACSATTTATASLTAATHVVLGAATAVSDATLDLTASNPAIVELDPATAVSTATFTLGILYTAKAVGTITFAARGGLTLTGGGVYATSTLGRLDNSDQGHVAQPVEGAVS